MPPDTRSRGGAALRRRNALLRFAAVLLCCLSAAPALAGRDNYLDWTWLGCWYDWGNPRSLPYYLGNGDYASCLALAEAGGFDTFGLQYYGECWACNGCDYAVYGSPGECEWLGTGNVNQVHRYFYPPPPLPANLRAGWNYLGCFKEGQPRMLPDRLAGVHTAASCQAAAKTAGYDTAAVQNGGECWACVDCNYGGFGAAAAADCPANGGPSTNQVYLLLAAPPPPMPPAWQVKVPLTDLVSGVSCVAGDGNTMTAFYSSSCGDIIKPGPSWNADPGHVRSLRCCDACLLALMLQEGLT